MKKSSISVATILLAIVLLAAPLCTMSAQAAVSPTQNAINLGLAWLAKQQDPSTGAWSLNYYPIASTAFALVVFATHKSQNLTDTTYDKNVTAGLKYLLSSGCSFQVNITADLIANPAHWTGPGTPATNGDHIGIYFRSVNGANDPDVGPYTRNYETGVVMMALQALANASYISPTNTVPTGSDSAIAGKTYYTIMGDMVNFCAWAQNDASSGAARGGWRYFPNAEDSNPWGASSDNSVSQWPTLGLIAAENWGIFAPTWVKSELLNYWLAYSQNSNGGFGYADNGSPTVPMTAAGLLELTYCGVPTNDSRWINAENFIGNNWGSDNIGNMYAMYGVMKAARTASPARVSLFGAHNWTMEYYNNLVNVTQVKSDGYGYWPGNGNRDTSPTDILTTEWALLILEKAVPPPHYLHHFIVSASWVNQTGISTGVYFTKNSTLEQVTYNYASEPQATYQLNLLTLTYKNGPFNHWYVTFIDNGTQAIANSSSTTVNVPLYADVKAEIIYSSPPPPPVGGISFAVSMSMTPWIILALIALAAAVAGISRRRIHKR